jgi:Glycosyltransferase (GlcNAc)
MRSKDQRIFISVAAYRDPELLPTLADCLEKARHPERLYFGICWQFGAEEQPIWFAEKRFRVLSVDWRESKGACWARAEIMKLWDGEEWYLQLDSHHKFVKDWDVRLLRQARKTRSGKPILTTYAPHYAPGKPILDSDPTRMEFDVFTEDGIALFRAGSIPDWQSLSRPIRSRFISAHFLFAPSSFIVDVPYDPTLYFLGEEITLAVRAYTHGYDLFHPSETIVWHEYTRNGRPKHWDDNADTFARLDGPSRIRARSLLLDGEGDPFGLGTVRTVAEYEAYAGISFRYLCCQDFTRQNFEPPNAPREPDWPKLVHKRQVTIEFPRDALPPVGAENFDFWYVGVQDTDGSEIFRLDALPEELNAQLQSQSPKISLTREFQSEAVPVRWTVIPHSEIEGWHEQINGPIDGGGLKVRAESRAPIVLVDRDPSILFPKVARGLVRTKVDGGFAVGVSASATEHHFINNSGALLLELANGEISLNEILEFVGMPGGPAGLSAPDVLSFYEAAATQRIVTLESPIEEFC